MYSQPVLGSFFVGPSVHNGLIRVTAIDLRTPETAGRQEQGCKRKPCNVSDVHERFLIFSVDALLTEEVVNEVEVFIGHVDTILVQLLIDFDEIHPTNGDEPVYSDKR